MVELGQVNICLEVSTISSHMDMPREGPMNELFHIFTHLRKYHNTEMVFGPSDLVIEKSKYQRRDWTSNEFEHVQDKQELPRDMPQLRGLGDTVRANIDTDHAGETVTRRSITGFFVYINSSLVYWFSKKNRIESSSFGSEFTVIK